jgi:hypothetical protein
MSLMHIRKRDSRLLPSSAKIVAAFCLLVTLPGCQSIRNGGAPDPSFDVDKDLKQLEAKFNNANDIADFYKNPSKDARDSFIAGRLVLMNVRYIQFIRKATSEKQLLDSASDILLLSLNLAGTATGGAAIKTILAAIASGVTGSKVVIDKHYFYEKTVPALIAAMNAERKQALVPILTGMKKPLNDYSFEQAVADLHAYYFAGTYMGAIQAIQVDSGAKEANLRETIQTLSEVTAADVDLKQGMTKAIANLTEGDLDKIKTVLAKHLPAEKIPNTFPLAKDELQRIVRNTRKPEDIQKLAKEFQDAQLLPK